MKILKYLTILSMALLSVSACSLDEKSFTEKSQDDYIKNTTEANSVLLGVYRTMTTDPMYGYYLSLYFTLTSDIAKVAGNTIDNYRNVPCNNYTSTEDEIEGSWQALYSAIYSANDFIERLSANVKEFPEAQQNLAAVYMAEARALRAMFYFELVRWYGNVVLITSTEQSRQAPTTFVQEKPETIFAYIEKELLYAIDNLPYANEDSYRSDNSFRFSKGAALGLLTKVYATWAGKQFNADGNFDDKWELAAKTAKTLIHSGNHGLLEDFDQLWKNSAESIWDATESLIEVSFYSPTITGTAANDPSGRIGKWNGVSAAEGTLASGRCAGNWRVVPTFAEKWYNSFAKDMTDLRFDISLADHRYAINKETGKPETQALLMMKLVDEDGKEVKDPVTGDVIKVPGTIQIAIDPPAQNEKYQAEYRKAFNENLFPGKWDMGKYTSLSYVVDANKSNVNWYILRYADVLLLYAEALNEWQKGPTAEAYAAVNMVRRRAYGEPLNQTSKVDLASGMGYSEFRQAVHDERAYELAFEGHRRQDLIRWGEFYDTIQNTYQGLAYWHEAAPGYYRCAEFTVEGKNEFLPIPQRDIDLCSPSLKQNPNW